MYSLTAARQRQLDASEGVTFTAGGIRIDAGRRRRMQALGLSMEALDRCAPDRWPGLGAIPAEGLGGGK